MSFLSVTPPPFQTNATQKSARANEFMMCVFAYSCFLILTQSRNLLQIILLISDRSYRHAHESAKGKHPPILRLDQ